MSPVSAENQRARQRLRELSTAQPRSSSELRREQLVKIAAYVVEFEGLDALKHARIAELAGCARPLVYNYFPKKSDIYLAISEAFYQRLEQRFSCEQQYQAVKGVVDRSIDSAEAIAMESVIWEVVDEFGCAGLILRCVPEINEAFREYHQELVQRYENRWLRYFQELGIGGLPAKLLLDNCVAICKNIALAYSDGQLGREQAIAMVIQQMSALIRQQVRASESSKQSTDGSKA